MKRICVLIYVICLFSTLSAVAYGDSLTSSEREAASKVEYIADREFFYYERDNVYVIRFSLKDKDKNRIASPCTVEAQLVNAEGTEVYSIKKTLSMTGDFSTWTWSSKLFQDRNGIYGTIYISPNDILKSKSAKGTMLIKVYLDKYISFAEKTIDVDELPTIDTSVIFPQLPKTISDKSYGNTAIIKITNMTYKYNNTTLKIYLTGELDFTWYEVSRMYHVGWRLIDEEGYIVKSGQLLTDSLGWHDKFKNKEIIIFDVEPGLYKLELRDVV